MNTKSIIGIVVAAIVVIGGAVWIIKAPASPAPVTSNPSLTTTTGTDALAPDQTAPDTDPTPTPAPATTPTATVPAKGTKVISTKTVNGMKIDVTKEGTGAEITNGQTASMLYTGKLADGTVFDSTAKRNNDPFMFQLGAGQVIKGWDLGVAGMKVGEQRTLTIPSDLAYGADGIPGVIPGGATLTFDVTLVAIK
jgi:FK506-binding nuclear protein